MSSIYIAAAGFLHRRPNTYKEADLHHTIPLLVCNRGLFDCIAPRLTQIYHAYYSPRTVMIAANACTFHLTREANLAMHYNQDVPATMAALRKFTQVASLTLFREENLEVDMSSVSIELTRFAPTLTKLDIACFTYNVTAADILANAIAELRNLSDLQVPLLTPKLCNALAAGPGPRLRDLSLLGISNYDAAATDVLVAGCPNILKLFVGGCSFDFVLSASKLQYLQDLHASVDALPAETDMRTAFGNMDRLTELFVRFGFSSLTEEFSNAMATIIATTVGPRLIELALDFGQRVSSDAFATLCCASSFPLLQRLSLDSHRKSVIEHDVTVSLSSSLLDLRLHRWELAPCTLAQLLANKPKLKDIALLQVTISCLRDDGDQHKHQSTQTPATEDDWFGQLVKSPVQKLNKNVQKLSKNVANSMDARVALLAPSLTDVKIEVEEGPVMPRYSFLGPMLRRCLLLAHVFVSLSTQAHNNSSPVGVDWKLACCGLRNNERLRSLTILRNVSSPNALVDELLAMRSTDLKKKKKRFVESFACPKRNSLRSSALHLQKSSCILKLP